MGSIARMDPKHLQVVGACIGHHLEPIAQNRVFKFERPAPLPLNAANFTR